MALPPQKLKATVQDFIKIVGTIEATELTSLDNAMATQPDTSKIELALEDAYNECMSAEVISCVPGKVLIRLQLRRLMVKIARYNLDSLKNRPDVRKDYEDCLALFEQARSAEVCEQPVADEVLEELGLLGAGPVASKSVTDERIWTRQTLTRYRTARTLNPW